MNSDPKISPPANAPASRILKRIGLSAVFLWFLIGGILHFTATGIGLFILTIAVTPANIYMLQHAELFNVPRWALILRLPFQVALLALILWCTKAMARAPNPASTANLQ
jgi:uncharacterized membrane protein